MKNKKFIVVCSNMRIPCDEDELIKVYQAISAGEPTILRQGWFRPSFWIGVIEDDETMKRMYEDLKYKIRDEGHPREYPKYPDLFPEIREQIKQLAESKRNGGMIRGAGALGGATIERGGDGGNQQ